LAFLIYSEGESIVAYISSEQEMNKNFFRLLAIVFFVPGTSYASCYKPDAPSCASGYSKFEDQDEFDSCKREMESYKSDIEDFLSCLKRDADEASNDYNDAVTSFNRRASQ
jgi:hypothetical protein